MKKIHFTASLFFVLAMLSGNLYSETLLVKQEAMHNSKFQNAFSPSFKADISRINPVPRVRVIPPQTSSNGSFKNNYTAADCSAGSGSAACSQFLASSGDVENNTLDFGMYGVIGSGIRLPDEQLESVDGLEDDWSVN